jgi:hypothetical protein
VVLQKQFLFGKAFSFPSNIIESKHKRSVLSVHSLQIKRLIYIAPITDLQILMRGSIEWPYSEVEIQGQILNVTIWIKNRFT